MLARLLDRMVGVLRTVHAADGKLLPFEGIVVHPELRQVLKKILPKLLDAAAALKALVAETPRMAAPTGAAIRGVARGGIRWAPFTICEPHFGPCR